MFLFSFLIHFSFSDNSVCALFSYDADTCLSIFGCGYCLTTNKCLPNHPADGVVDAIEEVVPPEELEMDENKKWTRVSIFLSVFNVHLQRIPVAGKITKLHYREGKFLNVSVDKYSKDNERQSCVIETENGLQFPVVQIAGLVARRIVCNLALNQEVKKGDKYGIIKFGSRVDIYLPEGVVPTVQIGQTMIAGESILARIK